MKRNCLKLVKRFRRFSYRADGATITELLVATVLIGVSMAALGEIMGLMSIMAGRANNRVAALESARNAISRMASDIRAARSFGDFYAENDSDRNTFPCNNNPVYGPGKIAVSNSPYKLSSHTLILQIPVFYNSSTDDPSSTKYNIFPLSFKSDSVTSAPIAAPPPAQSVENVDTVIYDIVSDGTADGWTLEMKRFPGAYISSFPSGMQQSNYKNLVDSPSQRVSGGIVGPKSRTGDSYPVNFKYYGRTIAGKTYQIDPNALDGNPALVNKIVGVGINFEIKKSNAVSSAGSFHDQQIGVHDEVFIRANRKG